MNVDLSYEQRARLELISIHTGKPCAEVLVDAAQFLLNRGAGYYPPSRSAPTQQFLPEAELEARLARILHR
jgi:hypothetical protein